MHTLKTIIGLAAVSAAVGCTSFNRDALWNAPIQVDNYCTYYKDDFPVGSKFVHKQDDWTDKRLKYGYELKVLGQANDSFLLDHGWRVYAPVAPKQGSVSDDFSPSFPLESLDFLYTDPILVKVLDPSSVKVGELFTAYGQYVFEGYETVKVGKVALRVKTLRQLNTDQTPVVKPYPFVYCR